MTEHPETQGIIINGRLAEQIIITDSNGDVMAVISKDEIIEKDGVSVAVDWS